MIKNIGHIVALILGNRDGMTSEKYFVILTTFIGMVFSLLLSVFHIINSITETAFLFAIGNVVLLFGLYCAVRFYDKVLLSKTIMTVSSLIILDFLWYHKFLSNGPILLFILIFSALILLLWNGKALFLLLSLYFLNLGILFYIDYNAVAVLFEYPNEHQRTADIYFSFFVYSTLLISLLYVFKRDFLKQKKKAIESEKLKSAFLANMSHEIRTPMNGILGFSDLLKNPELEPEIKQQYIEIIERSGNRMLNIINDIIDISRIEAGLVQVNRRPCDIHEKLKQLHGNFSAEVEAKGLTLIYQNLESVKQLVITTDWDKLIIVLIQLIKNAIKYSQQGTIAFGYHIQGAHITFFVKDSGIGVDVEKQLAIFERFVQADIDDVQARQGAGIGLFIAKSYVELLGGKIWMENEPIKGSKFSFTIPISAENNANLGAK